MPGAPSRDPGPRRDAAAVGAALGARDARRRAAGAGGAARPAVAPALAQGKRRHGDDSRARIGPRRPRGREILAGRAAGTAREGPQRARGRARRAGRPRRGRRALSAPAPRIVLASTSRYRRELLARLVPDFAVVAPDVDETPAAGETPATLAARLAQAKARAVAAGRTDALVIGSDQVAELDGRPIGKPGTPERARAQLAASAGRTLVFHTA